MGKSALPSRNFFPYKSSYHFQYLNCCQIYIPMVHTSNLAVLLIFACFIHFWYSQVPGLKFKGEFSRSPDQVLQRAYSLGLITEKHFRSKHKSCISIFVEGQSSSLLLQYVLLPSGLHLVLWWTCIIICGQFLPRRQFSFHQSRGNYWEFGQQVQCSREE